MEDVLRSINLVLGTFTLVWLISRRLVKKDWYPRGSLRRDIWVMALLWVASLVIGTCEQLFETGTYFRVVAAMAAILTTLSILTRPLKDWSEASTKSSR